MNRADPVSYRQLRLDDHAALIELWRSCDGLSLREADSRENTAKYLERNPGLSFVAETGERVVGSLMAGHDGRRGYIQHLAVAPERRGLGIAAELVRLCLEALAAQGIVKSHVHVLGTNRVGNDFWKGHGWIHRGEIEMYSFINGAGDNA